MTSFTSVVQSLRNTFLSGKTLPLKFRVKQLQALLQLVEQNEELLCSALAEDLRKSKSEAQMFETDILINEIKFTLNNIKDWVSPQYVKKTMVTVLDDSHIHYQPFGVALILGAWNYPVQLSMLPMVGAIAAGNVLILKPSELAPASSKVISELVPRYLDKDCYKVIPGGIPESTALLQEKYDIIFYTGGGNVAKIIHKAANENLTPLVLELGGKSPTYIDGSCDVEIAMKRVLWGKYINAGQTCIAPDYLLCQESIYDDVVAKSKKVIKEFYGEDPANSTNFCRIINNRHYNRLVKYLEDGTAINNGEPDESQLYIPPTILTDVKDSDPVMTEEIFGPILPIMSVKNEDEAIEFINKRDRPLALYVLSTKNDVIKKFKEKTTSGSLCCNDTMVFMGVPYLPFGGVGSSGCGRYHGKFSFDQFSHQKTVLVRNYMTVGEKLAEGRYPPFPASKYSLTRSLLKERNLPSFTYFPHILCFVFGVASVLVLKAVLKASGEDLSFL